MTKSPEEILEEACKVPLKEDEDLDYVFVKAHVLGAITLAQKYAREEERKRCADIAKGVYRCPYDDCYDEECPEWWAHEFSEAIQEHVLFGETIAEEIERDD